MAFAFELPDPNCPRRFLVCHPVMLNYVLSKRPSSQQCTYEIIQEAVQCKLYLDIEFEYAYNQISFMDGERMQATFLLILERFLNAQFNISCNEQDFLDLDSSDVAKFSRHVILNARGAVFSNNHIVGNVVKFVCEEITGEYKKLIRIRRFFSINSLDFQVVTTTTTRQLFPLRWRFCHCHYSFYNHHHPWPFGRLIHPSHLTSKTNFLRALYI